jgi:hypothetical protein
MNVVDRGLVGHGKGSVGGDKNCRNRPPGLAAQFIDQRNAIFLVEMEIGEDHVNFTTGAVIGAKRLGAAQCNMG